MPVCTPECIRGGAILSAMPGHVEASIRETSESPAVAGKRPPASGQGPRGRPVLRARRRRSGEALTLIAAEALEGSRPILDPALGRRFAPPGAYARDRPQRAGGPGVHGRLGALPGRRALRAVRAPPVGHEAWRARRARSPRRATRRRAHRRRGGRRRCRCVSFVTPGARFPATPLRPPDRRPRRPRCGGSRSRRAARSGRSGRRSTGTCGRGGGSRS